jgi:hypothetical protein
MSDPQGRVSTLPTPYLVHCIVHGKVFLTMPEYMRQLTAADARWSCPECGRVATWDDENYERFQQDDHDA